jgi:tetratricopeptide (TPR) repeat protein
MVRLSLSVSVLLVGLVSASLASTQSAQSANDRERARSEYERGMDLRRREALEEAARAFASAVRTDPTFDMALYMLGRTHLDLKQYVEAVTALRQCRDLHLAEASQRSDDRREGNRLRRERVQEINRSIGELERVVPQTERIKEQIRQFRERVRQIQDLGREDGLRQSLAVPAFVSLSLGSAHFRTGNLAEAEKAYLETVSTDPKIGEAYNNLAVVYMETGRYELADNAVTSAEKTGLQVSPALKQEICRRAGREGCGTRARWPTSAASQSASMAWATPNPPDTSAWPLRRRPPAR